MFMQTTDTSLEAQILSQGEVQDMADRIVEEILKRNQNFISEDEIEKMVECELRRVC